jgi:hypothetical protein
MGHLYDPEKHSSCPHCGIELDIDDTKPKPKPRPDPVEETNKTNESDIPTRGKDHKRDGMQREAGATVGLFKKKMGIDPVVGWLVCVKGPDKGRDFRIRSERNFIGRDTRSDICIPGDESISREKHAVISYNPKKNSFKIAPGESRSMVYLNDEDVDAATEIQAYDRVSLGETDLLFVPFCGDRYQWPLEDKQ